jgi:hypothetical protein
MPAPSPAIRVHTAIGALTYRLGDLVTGAGLATSADPFAIAADRTLANIAHTREVLAELELAILAIKADGEVARAA